MERPTLAKALAACEQRRVQLQCDLAVLDGTARASTVDVKGIEKALRGKLKDWRRRRQADRRPGPERRTSVTVGMARRRDLEPLVTSESGRGAPGGLTGGLTTCD